MMPSETHWLWSAGTSITAAIDAIAVMPANSRPEEGHAADLAQERDARVDRGLGHGHLVRIRQTSPPNGN